MQLLSSAITFIEQRSSSGQTNDRNPGLCELLRSLHADLVSRVHRSTSASWNVHERSTGAPVADREHVAVLGLGDLNPGTLEYLSFPYEEHSNIPLALDFNFPSNDVPNWAEFLQMLDLPGDLVTN